MLGECGDTRFLIDCGIGPRVLANRLEQLHVTIDSLAFVYITHEHSDHVRAIPQLLKRQIRVITSNGTATALGLSPRQYQPVNAWHALEVEGVDLLPLPVSHDAAEPLGVRVGAGGRMVALLTDIGRRDSDLVRPLAEADAIVLEANHDMEMLNVGPYPEFLKRRVRSARGHLSNRDCASMILEICESSGRSPTIRLAHLSTTNNTPELARAEVQAVDRNLDVDVLDRSDSTSVPCARASRSSQARQMTMDFA